MSDGKLTKHKGPQGFATLTSVQRSRVSSRGGTLAHAAGVAHKFTASEARKAALKRWGKAANDEDEAAE